MGIAASCANKTPALRSGQMEMEPEGIISFVRSATFGEVHKPADCRARNGVSIRVITRGNGIDIPVVATVGSHRVTSDLHKCSFRFPIWTHVNPVFGSVAVKEMDDQRAHEGLVGRHGDHVVRDLRAFVLDVRTYIVDSEWRIGYCSSTIGYRNRMGKADADHARSRAQRIELPVTPYNTVVPVGRQKAGYACDVVGVRAQPITLNV